MNSDKGNFPPVWLGIAVFITSGFAGLVYEATWARYLKGVLGHQAYAQVLVLVIFLGGLAAGAAIASGRLDRLRHPLVGYAAIEAVLALAAVYFHDIFVLVRGWLEGGIGASGLAARWASMTLMILPQSLLLGATFPLLAAAMTRSAPAERGKTVSILYFANSFGGVLGALAVGFFLVDFAGLPGSMLAGACASAAAGLAAWAAHHRYETPAVVAATAQPQQSKGPVAVSGKSGLFTLLAIAAFGTGFASLVYEIIWVRMLALLLGSTSRAFEIMLATFILGLAIGSLVIRNFADRGDRLRMLAWAQIMMGVFVILTMFLYESVFPVLAIVRDSLPLTEGGYLAYGLTSFLVSLVMMFLPTFFAGMTLPLLTREAMVTHGEKSLGTIYAWNTFGSIVGILVAINFLMPALGLKYSLAVGIVVDLGLGVMFLSLAQPQLVKRGFVAAVAALLLIMVFKPYKESLLSSGPYYRSLDHNLGEVLYSKHGKTSTVLVKGYETGTSILNNGKPDGFLVKDRDKPNRDMYTNAMSAALALLLKPDAKTVGVIGLGTGHTVETMLLSDNIESLEVMEIEGAVLEALDYFWSSESIRTDPRAQLLEVDGKAHMASKKPGSYDIIVSIPTHAWVSGVSSLFTTEHFVQMKRALSEDGVLVQWFYTYDSNPQAIASILAAAGDVFGDYMLYSLTASDFAIVLRNGNKGLGSFPDDAMGRLPRLAERLRNYDIHSLNDVKTHAIGNRGFLEPYIETFKTGANSDYFPLLEHYASLGFYQETLYSLPHVVSHFGHLFNSAKLSSTYLRTPFMAVSPSSFNIRQNLTHFATALLDMSRPIKEGILAIGEFRQIDFGRLFDSECPSIGSVEALERGTLLYSLSEVAESSLSPEELAVYWARVADEMPCLVELRKDESAGVIVKYAEAMANGSPEKREAAISDLLGNDAVQTRADAILLTKLMVSQLDSGRPADTIKTSMRLDFTADADSKHAIRLVGAHALLNIEDDRGDT